MANEQFQLMHKNVEVLTIEVLDNPTKFGALKNINSFEHLPSCVSNNKTISDDLFTWWTSRLIPNSRVNLSALLTSLNRKNQFELAQYAMGLSLSDHYWLKPVHLDLKWEEVNFFDHPFSEEVSDIFIISPSNRFRNERLFDNIELKTPNAATNGILIKKWTNIDGIYHLCKYGTKPFFQEPANEAFASILLDRLNINHVPYFIEDINEKNFSLCPNFTDRNTELIPASELLPLGQNLSGKDLYQKWLDLCEQAEIPEAKKATEQMLLFDYLIGNTDRHFTNFGLLRQADTLKYTGFAPIFDNGFSFWYNIDTKYVSGFQNLISWPFISDQREQLKLITDFDNFDLSKIKNVETDFFEFYNESAELSEERQEAIFSNFDQRIKKLNRFINSQKNEQPQ